MKITDLEILRMKAHTEPHNNWLFVRIHTDSGLSGIGEGSLQYKDAALTAELEAFGSFLRGKDPFQIEDIWTSLHRRLNLWSARRVALKLEPLDIAWLEEPILFDNADAMAAFAHSVRVPVSTGEELYTRWEFRPLLEQNAVDIIQPDICHAGGMSELRKIAAMAETYYVTLAPHNSNGPISTVASLHLDMAIPNCHMQELFLNSVDFYQEVLTHPLVIADGFGAPPDGPGWGTDIDDAALAKYPPSSYTPIDSEPYVAF